MANQYDNELQGVLFKNDKEGNEKRPDYTGTAQINGSEYRMAAWIREGKASGKKFMSISFTDETNKQPAPEETPEPGTDLPF